MNNKVKILQDLIYDEAGHARNAGMDALRRKDKPGWHRWNKYIVDNDKNAIGYQVKKEKGDKQWHVYDDRANIKGLCDTEEEGWKIAREEEAMEYIENGGSPQWAEQLISYRTITRKLYKQYRAGIERIIQRAKERNEDPPVVVYRTGKGTVKISLEAALAKMGNRQGYYLPRIRHSGRLTLIGIKENQNPERWHFDLGAMNPKQGKIKSIMNYPLPIMRKYRELKRKGYYVQIERSDKMPEDVFPGHCRPENCHERLD